MFADALVPSIGCPNQSYLGDPFASYSHRVSLYDMRALMGLLNLSKHPLTNVSIGTIEIARQCGWQKCALDVTIQKGYAVAG
jgi:hypothetical protein